MFDALQIAATGMHAQQMNVDTIANNLANMNTMGFKKSRVGFADLISLGITRNDHSIDTQGVGRERTGLGVGVSSVTRLFDLGDVKRTDSPMDILIAGDGFLEVVLPDGGRAYSRGGTLQLNGEGMLATQSGQALKPGINIPTNADSIVIASDGKISAKLPNQSSLVELGTLDMVRFTNAGALEAIGDNLYKATDSSGEAVAGRAGEDGLGTLQQGQLEASNVKLVDEMVNLMVAQRAYEASVKVAQASDEMLGLINNLRK